MYNIYTYNIYGLVTLLYTWNIVNQLYFNNNKKRHFFQIRSHLQVKMWAHLLGGGHGIIQPTTEFYE